MKPAERAAFPGNALIMPNTAWRMICVIRPTECRDHHFGVIGSGERYARRKAMRFITRNDFHRAVFILTFAATFCCPAFAAETTSIPDLSGIWGRWFNFEPPSSGPGPVVSKLRRPDGSIIHSVVGDFTNPILRPHAAEVVKKNGELELRGIVIPNPHNQCRPEPTPFALSIQLGMQSYSRRTKSLCCTFRTIRCAMCAWTCPILII